MYRSSALDRRPPLEPYTGPVLPWLADRQYAALVALAAYLKEHAHYPTTKELAERLSASGEPCSMSRARALVEALIEKGYATKGRGHRSLQLTEAAIEKLRRDAAAAEEAGPKTQDLFDTQR